MARRLCVPWATSVPRGCAALKRGAVLEGRSTRRWVCRMLRSARRAPGGCTAGRLGYLRPAGTAARGTTAAGAPRRRTRAFATCGRCATGRGAGAAGACVRWGRTVRRGHLGRRCAGPGSTAGARGCGRRAGRATQGTTALGEEGGARGLTAVYLGPGRVQRGRTVPWEA